MTKKAARTNEARIVDGGPIDLEAEQVNLADGTRLTEDRAVELADEVLQAIGRGRPSLTAPGRRSPQLRLTIPDQLRISLQQRADAEHRSVSELAREALERYLAS